MDTLRKDIAYAARTLRKSPAFTLTAMITLALGIGATTAIFSVMKGVLLRPLPYADPDRLVLVWGNLRNRNLKDFPMSPGDFQDMRNTTRVFSGFTGVVTFVAPLAGDGAEPEQIRSAAVTQNFFSLLGSKVIVGRDFVESDVAPNPTPPPPPPGAPAVAAPPPLPGMLVLSYDFWKRRYGGDRGVIGRSVMFGGLPAQIVGVLEPGVQLLFPPRVGVERSPEAWVAARIDFADTSLASRINVFLRVIGRLKPGVTLAQGRAELTALAADLRQRYPIDNTAGLAFDVTPMHQDLVADVRPAIVALMGAVVFVLLIACANVANLLLVRATGRQRELAVRAALGGSQWRLVRQTLWESLLLGLGGIVLGLSLAALGIKLLVLLAPDSLPRVNEIAIDPGVLAFTTIAGLLSVAVFGVLPAVRASRPDIMDVLRASGRTTGQRTGSLVRSGVVLVEVALSFVLLAGCGLMLRSFIALQATDPGFEPHGVLTFFAVTTLQVQDTGKRQVFVRELGDRLRALPGVQAVTAGSRLPLDGTIANARWGREDAVTDPTKFRQANLNVVLPGYFEVMRTKLIAGRTFTEADNVPDSKAIVIDDVIARKAFGTQPPVGQRLLVRAFDVQPVWYEIIGVVAHQHDETLAAEGREGVFLTDGQGGFGNVARWALRTSGDPMRLANAARAAVRSVDPTLPAAQVQPFDVFVDRAKAPTRFALVLIGAFAMIALALAAVGLYGVLSTVVRQRTSEIGMRMAFGAPSASIFRLVIGYGVRLSAIGVAVGIVAAFLLTRLLASMLVGVRPTDPLTYGGIAVLFLAVAAAACWLPARRAAALEPTVALREE